MVLIQCMVVVEQTHYSIGSGDADSTTLVSDAFGVKGDVINEIGGDLGSSLLDLNSIYSS